jgi:glycosyltransferase involved in cell wall biosynthesis
MSERDQTKVFVLLGYGFGADSWRRRFCQGLIPGLNEELPYGYYRASGNGWSIEYSQDIEENAVRKLWRRGWARLLGFDLIHAWRNRKSLFSADIVWTHTEREHLAVLFLYRFSSQQPPKLIAQCIWLFDRWPAFSALRRWSYRRLLERADVITTQSPDDLAAAQRLFPKALIECVFSGAAIGQSVTAHARPVNHPIRIAALGNDMHRDWETLVLAFGRSGSDYMVKIASAKFDARLLRHAPNISIVAAATQSEVRELYEWADIVVVPLRENLHVSGITVVFEAIVLGIPVVCTDTGGMRAYFSDLEVRYVPPYSAGEMRVAVDKLAADDQERLRLTTNAQARLLAANLTKQGYADRHRALSERILQKTSGKAHPRTGAETNFRVRADQAVKVFVHLGCGFGATKWRERYAQGLIAGLNEPLPYGYYRAAGGGWSIEYSEDRNEGLLTQLSRRGLTRLLGFDLMHAWRNRHGLLGADIIWTHTERENLAAILILRMLRPTRYPAIIAQCIWLFDRWSQLPLWKRNIYMCLLRQADVVTTHSPDNLNRAREILPNQRVQLVMFGVQPNACGKRTERPVAKPIRIAALGNDMHRDWQTLIKAFGGFADYRVKIAAASIPRSLISDTKNISIRKADTAHELASLYDWADIIVVPLKHNSHASGITVILEATLSGLPVVSSDTGGLRRYFSEEEIRYVPVLDPSAMRAAVDAIAADGYLRKNMVLKAQERIQAVDLTAQGFADRHRQLSEDILFGTANELTQAASRVA